MLKRLGVFSFAILIGVFAAPLWAAPAAASAPNVNKAEPPNWWVGLKPDLMVLLSGENLDGAAVSVAYPGVRVKEVDARPGGHYVFVWLRISPQTRPGTLILKVRTAAGSTDVKLPLAARSSTQGKFRGLSKDDVLYLIMPDRFVNGDPSNDNIPSEPGTFDRSQPRAYWGGDLRGIRQKLPYLRDLGVTALWLTPFNRNTDADYHGYHITDFYDVEEHLGTMEELQLLVKEARQQGIKLVIDFVVNHVGPKHPWAKSPPTPTWINGTPQNHLEPVYRFNGIVDPHASRRESRGTLEGWFAGRLPDLNTDDPYLAEYLLVNAVWWTEMTGLDAYRLDTFPYSSLRFWSNWHKELFRIYPKTSSIGEIWDGDVTITSFFQGGRARFHGIDTHLPTLFDFPMMYAVRDVILRNQPAQRIVDVLTRDWLYSHPDWLVTFFGNHDIRRFISESGASRQKLKLALSLLFAMRGIPQLYYGDEFAMEGGDDPDNRRIPPGGSPGDPRDAFTAAGRTPAEQEVFVHLQSLIKLRRVHPALHSGKHWHIGWGEKYYAFLREAEGDRVLVVFHNGESPETLKLDLRDTPLENAQSFAPLFEAGSTTLRDKTLEVSAAPRTVAMYQVK